MPTYPLLKVKQKYQVTIPREVRKDLHIKEGDYLEPVVEGGKITLTPKEFDPRPKKLGHSAMKFLGAGAKYSSFKNAQEVDDFIRSERDAWKD